MTGYGPLLHGEAVAFGMAVEARIAARRGWLAGPVLDRLLAVLAPLRAAGHAPATFPSR